jgi:hypothetical protein
MSMTNRVRTAVVHLVRHANGLKPFEAFLASYRRFDAGLEHDLVLLFKGFPDPRDADPYLDRAADVSPARRDVTDKGLDLTAYFAVARTLDYERLCFLNSFSEVVAPGWLALLDAALRDREVGAAGATGSWASHLSYDLLQLGFPGGYAEVFEDRRAVRRLMHDLSGATYRGDAAHWLLTLANAALHIPTMSGFPSVHLRTNAFLIDRQLFCSLKSGRTRAKLATYRLESGRRSITAQLRALGRPPVVVDRHGVARHGPDWPAGRVFWQADQEDLLVADNQTRTYASATTEQRHVLARYAWGLQARSS